MPTVQISDISVDITYKKIKNVHLSVYPPHGKVRVSAPLKMNAQTIRMFLISKLSWIRSQQEKLENQERQEKREFLNRESHYYKGKRYLLKINESQEKTCIDLDHKHIILNIRNSADKSKCQKAINEWYRKQLKEVIPKYIKRYEKLLKVEVAEFGVKRMKTRWGTCNPDAKRIWINLELAKKPSECLEYIVVHEMVHIIEPTHNNRFVSLMDLFMPKWKYYKDELNKLPVSHEHWKY